jgi:hypothetical protein
MLIPVEATDSFDIEPGRYKTTCVDVREIEKQTRKGTEKFLRLIWELDIPGSENIRYLAGKNYKPSLAKDSPLRNDLITWYGHDINARQFDTTSLKGKEAIITVQHIENEGRDKPFCWVSRVEPLVDQDEADEARTISPKVVCG